MYQALNVGPFKSQTLPNLEGELRANMSSLEDYCAYKDPNQLVEARIKDVISRMTLRQKAAQMTMIEKHVAHPSTIKDLSIGGVYAAPESSYPHKVESAISWANIVDATQEAAMDSSLGIPLFYASDAIHGQGNVYGATIFPHNVGIGATRDIELVRRIGIAAALEFRATGTNYALGPVLAVIRDPRWGRCYESYSEDTDIVRSMSVLVSGLQGRPPHEHHPSGYPFLAGRNNVIACGMHFVGAGGTEMGHMEGNTKGSYAELERIHMRPYLDSLDHGVSSFVVSYTRWNGIRMHAHDFLLTKILKDKHGFKGIVLSDWEGIDTICEPYRADYRYCVAASINAGIDMVLEPFRYEEFIDTLVSLVDSGDVSIARIDDALERILRVKFIAGLFEHPFIDRSLLDRVGCKAHRDLAREAVRKSLVLLKNGKAQKKPLLPLDKNCGSVLVAGRHGDDLGYQCGGWTITKYGSSGRITIGTTILEAVKEAIGHETKVTYDPNLTSETLKGQDFSYAIAVVGEAPYAESKGYNTELLISFNGVEIINLLAKQNIPTLVILISGRPLVLEASLLEKMDGLIAAWLPGSEGGGVADVIFGEYEFEGLLPVTWFKNVDQLPMNYGDEFYDPQFPLGFGLRMNE